MKALILVNGVGSIPVKIRNNLYVVTNLNWQECYQFFQGKDCDIYLFLHELCDSSRLLKLVEDYPGNLALYTSQLVDSVFMSRFTRVLNRRQYQLDTDQAMKQFTAESANQTLLNHLKSIL